MTIRPAAVTWSALALLLEAMSVLCACSDCWLIASFAHVSCAACLGLAAAHGELERRLRSAASVALWALCVPVLAALGLSAVLIPALCRVRAQAADGVLEIELAQPKVVPPRAAGALSLREPLGEQADDSSQRVAALMSLRNTELTRAAPLLRTALLDADEDMRLLAYALLERREKALRARIEACKAQLTDQSLSLFVPLSQLCSDHWLLAEAGFVSGDTAANTLADALEYGERALWLDNDAALRVLLARICLRADKPERAQAHLRHAQRLGSARSVLSPLFAHAAFLQGRYEEVGPLLSVSAAARLARPEERGARALWADMELV